jgi:hypothetical protein
MSRKLSTLLCLLGAAGLAQAEETVIESLEPREPPRTVELRELWRVGGEDDQQHLFGTLIDARCDAAGNVYLLDQQLATVTVIGPDGRDVAVLGGEGDGPGECRMPQTMALFDDGSVGLGQRFPGRFVRVDLANDPLPSVDVGGPEAAGTGYTMLVSARNRGGTLLAAVLQQVPDEHGQSRQSRLLRLGPDGAILSELASHSTYLDFRDAHFVEREMVAPLFEAHTVGPDGLVYLTPERDAYRIDVLQPDGTLVRRMTRKFSNPPRDRKTLDRVDALFAEQARALPFAITWEVSPVDPAITGLHVTRDGRLLVSHARSSRDLPDGVFTRYDVFGADGRWLHEMHVRCTANPDHDGLIWLDDGRVLLVKGLQLAQLTASGTGGAVSEETDGAAALEVICCRVD